MKIIKNIAANKSIEDKSKIFAADEDDFEFFADDPEPAFDTTVDAGDVDFDMPEDSDNDVSDDSEEEDVEQEYIEEDDVSIQTDNNIANHYIAECDICKGIFISSIVESDMEVDMLSGVCPVCGKESDMYLKWIVKDIDE